MGKTFRRFRSRCQNGYAHVQPAFCRGMGLWKIKYMTHMVYYAFHKGKYDSNLIIYLVHFYRGMLWQLEEIWKAAVSFEVETYEICERILVQTCFPAPI